MEKLDARKRYTQKVLKQSFLTLLKDKPVNKITVKEVCALAQLNRATFYAHYSDCFDLMESIEQELIDAFAKSMRYAGSLDVTALIEAIYDMVEKNQVACRVLILGNARRTLIIDRPTDRPDRSALFGCPSKFVYAFSRRVLPALLDGRNAPFCVLMIGGEGR